MLSTCKEFYRLAIWKKKKNTRTPFKSRYTSIVNSVFLFVRKTCVKKSLISALWQHCTCLVPLHAKNPNIRINPPRADNGTEWPGMGTGRPFLSNLPILGPMRTQPTNAQTAEKKNNDRFSSKLILTRCLAFLVWKHCLQIIKLHFLWMFQVYWLDI